MSSYRLIRRADGWLVCVGQGSMLVFAQKRDAIRVIRDADRLLKPAALVRKARRPPSQSEAPSLNAKP